MTPPRMLVVGAGPGIGLAIARRFAREGFHPTLVLRRDDDAEPLVPHLPPDPTFVTADLTDPKTLGPLSAWIADHLPDPEIFLYNASAGARSLPSQLAPEALEESLQVNLRAPLHLVRTLLPGFRRRGSGTLLFTGGGLALEPQAQETALSIGKAALRHLALCLADELAPEGLHVATLTVAGFVQTGQTFSPDTVAEAAWELHTEQRGSWRREVVLQPECR